MITDIMISTRGESFVDITDLVKRKLESTTANKSGILVLYIVHTSCALTINEAFDSSAKEDMQNFLKHLAPRNLSFITHDAEGADDSPSHMKSLLLNQNLVIPIEKGSLVMGTWQGIYLCEFRDRAHERKVLIKFIEG